MDVNNIIQNLASGAKITVNTAVTKGFKGVVTSMPPVVDEFTKVVAEIPGTLTRFKIIDPEKVAKIGSEIVTAIRDGLPNELGMRTLSKNDLFLGFINAGKTVLKNGKSAKDMSEFVVGEIQCMGKGIPQVEAFLKSLADKGVSFVKEIDHV